MRAETALHPLYAKFAMDVKSHGQSVVQVGGDGPHPSFNYTIGNALVGLPELLLVGSIHPMMGLALNHLGQKMRDDKKPLEEGLVDIGWTFPFKVRKASPKAKTEYTIQAGRFFDHEDYEVLQVMICDKDGKYPDDPECAAPYAVELV